jgi:hypothetical protein
MRTGSLILAPRPSGADPAGGGPSFFFASAIDGAFTSNPAALPIPAGLAAGDFVFLHASSVGTTPSGFTRLLPAATGSFYYYKFADAADASAAGTGSWSLSYTGDTYVVSIAVYRGVNSATPFASGPADSSGSGTTINGPSMTGPGLYVQSLTIDSNTDLTANPSGMTLRNARSAWGRRHYVTDAPLATGVGSAFPATQALGFPWTAFAMLLQ